jgi:hypothetical protein
MITRTLTLGKTPIIRGMSTMPRRRLLPDAGSHVSIRALAIAIALTLLAAPAALAHVDVDVGDGKYVLEVGFRDEPAFAGQPNAVYLHVGEYGTGGTKPVDGLASTLKAEVSKDGQTLSPPLVPMGDGAYEAVFVPTETGDYTFHITGTIGDAPVDETITSGPSTFDSVQPLSAIAFPPQQEGASAVETAVQNAEAAAAMARNLAIAGIVVGLLGLIAAGVAMARAARPAPAVAVEPRPAVSESSGKLIR